MILSTNSLSLPARAGDHEKAFMVTSKRFRRRVRRRRKSRCIEWQRDERVGGTGWGVSIDIGWVGGGGVIRVIRRVVRKM